MIDPTKVTDYNRNTKQLQEYLLFCIGVAGKKASVISQSLENFLQYAYKLNVTSAKWAPSYPFGAVLNADFEKPLAGILKSFGFGCHTRKARGFLEAANSKLDLKTCNAKELEEIYGVGMKTSRFFLLHSREKANVACLDTHILKWLKKESGLETIPKQTPTSKRQYKSLEKLFLFIAEDMGMDVAELDLQIWNEMSGSNTR